MTLPALVIDTNWVLDLWVFDDPRADAVRQAVQTEQVRWLSCAPMRIELERVLGYPAVAKRLQAIQRKPLDVLEQFDRWSQPQDLPLSCPVRCKDPDDQIFIDLAVAHQATLLSKDDQVLRLHRRLLPLGVQTCSSWFN